MAHCTGTGARQDQRHKMLTSRGRDTGQLCRAQSHGAYMIFRDIHFTFTEQLFRILGLGRSKDHIRG